MNELRLVFHLDPQTGTSVKALPVWSGSDATQPVPFDFSLGDDDFEDLRWYLEDFMDLPDGGAVVRAEGIEGKLRNWGRQLHDTVFFPLHQRKESEHTEKVHQEKHVEL